MRYAALLFVALPMVAQTFDKDVAPIFAAYCIGCHTGNVKMGGLDLDTVDGIRKGGNHGTVLVDGKSDESRLYLMIAGKMAPAMPLSGKSLAAGEIETVRKWIDAGAQPGGAVNVSKLTEAGVANIKPRTAVKPQVAALAFRPDGKLLALGSFKEVRLADLGGKTLATLPGHAEVVRAVAFSPDGKRLAAAGGLPGRQGEVRIWDVDRRTEVRVIEAHTDCIYAVAFSPDGRTLATSSYDKLIKLWDTETGRETRVLKDHIDAVYALAFTPDGKRLVSAAADRTVKIWDPATGERLYTLSEATDGLNTVAIHPSGKIVAAGGLDKTVRVWSLGDKGGSLLNSLIAHEDAILKLAYSPDGKLLVSTAADRTIKLLKSDDLAEIRTWARQPDWVLSLEFAPDGKSFAAGRFDGSVQFFDVNSQVAVR
ncbi:MAG: c-type cytochrome domain-containing protein [Bryobacteraceae bacterium]